MAELPGLEAVLVNCCSPQAVTAALPVLQAAAPPGVRIGGYANGFRVSTSGARVCSEVSEPSLRRPFRPFSGTNVVPCVSPPRTPPALTADALLQSGWRAAAAPTQRLPCPRKTTIQASGHPAHHAAYATSSASSAAQAANTAADAAASYSCHFRCFPPCCLQMAWCCQRRMPGMHSAGWSWGPASWAAAVGWGPPTSRCSGSSCRRRRCSSSSSPAQTSKPECTAVLMYSGFQCTLSSVKSYIQAGQNARAAAGAPRSWVLWSPSSVRAGASMHADIRPAPPLCSTLHLP